MEGLAELLDGLVKNTFGLWFDDGVYSVFLPSSVATIRGGYMIDQKRAGVFLSSKLQKVTLLDDNHRRLHVRTRTHGCAAVRCFFRRSLSVMVMIAGYRPRSSGQVVAALFAETVAQNKKWLQHVQSIICSTEGSLVGLCL